MPRPGERASRYRRGGANLSFDRRAAKPVGLGPRFHPNSAQRNLQCPCRLMLLTLQLYLWNWIKHYLRERNMTTVAPTFDPQMIWSRYTLYQIVIGSAFITAVINVTWFLISQLVRYFVRAINKRPEVHTFTLGRAMTRP